MNRYPYSLEDLTSYKHFYKGLIIVPSIFSRWKQEREKYQFDGNNVLSDSRLRMVMDDEIIIEFDYKDDSIEIGSEKFNELRKRALSYIKKIKDIFVEKGIYFYITDHKGKSPHLRFFIRGLEDYDSSLRKEYKKIIVYNILKGINFDDDELQPDESLMGTHLLAIENKPHFKEKYNGEIERVVYANEKGKNLAVLQKIIDSIKVKSKKEKSPSKKDYKVDKRQLRYALQYIDADDYDEWLHIGMALKLLYVENNNDEEFFEIFDEWSKNSEKKYDPDVVEEKWATFSEERNDKSFTVGSIFHKAKENGWVKPNDILKLFKPEELSYQLALQNYASNQNDVAHEIIVEILKRKYIIKVIDTPKRDEIHVYHANGKYKGLYKDNGLNVLKKDIREGLGMAYNENKAIQIISRLTIDNIIGKDEFFNQNLEYPYLCAVNNGIIDLKTKKILPFSPKYYFFNKIPHDYVPNAKCPRIQKFFYELVNEKEYVDTLQELFGFVLVRNYFDAKAFMFEGKTAGNGKSVIMKLFELFVGTDLYVTRKISDMDKDSRMIYDLFGKLINYSPEVNESALNNSGCFKDITGNDKITIDRKHISSISFYNYAKLIFTANELPIPKNPDEGFWRRWVKIPFNNKFVSEAEYEKYPENKRKNIFIKDQHIIDKISIEEEMEGLLIYAIEGLHRYLNNGSFTCEKPVDELKLDWESKSKSVVGFLKEYFVKDTGYKVRKDVFRYMYGNYCDEIVNRKRDQDEVIKNTMLDMMNSFSKRMMYAHQQEWFWINIRMIKTDNVTDISLDEINIPINDRGREESRNFKPMNVEDLKQDDNQK